MDMPFITLSKNISWTNCHNFWFDNCLTGMMKVILFATTLYSATRSFHYILDFFLSFFILFFWSMPVTFTRILGIALWRGVYATCHLLECAWNYGKFVYKLWTLPRSIKHFFSESPRKCQHQHEHDSFLIVSILWQVEMDG